MLDQDDGGAIAVARVAHMRGQFLLLAKSDAGERFVEQQQRRPRDQRARQLDALLQTVRQGTGGAIAHLAEVQEADDVFSGGKIFRLDPPRQRRAGDLAQKAGTDAVRQPHQDVVEHGKALEHCQILERPRHAMLRQPRRRHMGEGILAEPHPAPVGPVEPADDVEQRALAGPVGPDHRADLALRDLELDVAQRGDAAERERDVRKRKHRPCGVIASRREQPVPRTGSPGQGRGERRLHKGAIQWKHARACCDHRHANLSLITRPPGRAAAHSLPARGPAE
ncbi:hypothetical protein ACVWZR_005330 [Bradyrhizobium sp. i1.3.1]